MAKKVSEIERGAGFFQALVTGIMDIARENEIPFEAIHRMTTPAGRSVLEGIVAFAYADYLQGRTRPKPQAEELPPDHYRVFVDYQMPRDQATLESEFSKDGVSELFTGDYEWENHSSCANADQTPGERVMFVKHFDREIDSEVAIAEMESFGYRPATHLEAYAFAKANPEPQRRFWIVALGSTAVYGDSCCVAVLHSVAGGRFLADGWFGEEWGFGRRFLFVRK